MEEEGEGADREEGDVEKGPGKGVEDVGCSFYGRVCGMLFGQSDDGIVDVGQVGQSVDEFGYVGSDSVVDFAEVDGGGLRGEVPWVVGWGGGEVVC